MKLGHFKSIKWKYALAVALSVTACKQAGYEVLKPGLVSPNNFDSSKSLAPTARVEVIDRGVSVTWVFVGTKVDIRPSADTLDADYIGKEKCENPGIIEADYDLGNTQAPVVKRDNCSSLTSKDQVFNAPGDYLVKMVVKSKDNEQATASMTLRVVDKSTPVNQIEGGFTIHAKPILVGTNQPVTFTGVCELKGKLTIDWNYGDSAKETGAVLTHSYAKPGQYLVNATCTSDSGKKMDASLTVVVMNGTVPAIPNVAVPIPNQNPNIPTTPAQPNTPNCDPTQGPCQNTTQMPQGSQQLPDNTDTTWYYDPYCHCYDSIR